jgi:hypothetical protein
MAKVEGEVDLQGYAVVSTGGIIGHLVPFGESATLCGKGTGRMPYLRDLFEPREDCPECYREYRKYRERLDKQRKGPGIGHRLGWRRSPWGWASTAGRSRWSVRGPIFGIRMYWLYRDGCRYTPTGRHDDVVCFRSAGSAKACAERLEEKP